MALGHEVEMPARVQLKYRSLDEVVAREIRNAHTASGARMEILDDLMAHGFSREELFELVVPRRTLARRRESGNRLSTEESDRAVRLARITAHAERVFGNDEKAHGWLREPSRTLGGTVPLDLLRTETGAQLVEQTLHRYDYGMLA
jgi:putative toxin-antitoxin system antitoxin component (TIGR02293 family)